MGAEAGLTVVMFCTSTVWMGSSGGAGVLKMVGVRQQTCCIVVSSVQNDKVGLYYIPVS